MKNKYILATMLVAIMVLSIVAFIPSALAANPGNGAETGKHFHVNIIGVQNPKNFDPDNYHDNNGKVIFVGLSKTGKVTSEIHLVKGDRFEILDHIGTDADGATIMLKDPYPGDLTNSDGEVVPDTAVYTIYGRLLGNPNGHVDMTTTIKEGGNTWVSLDTVSFPDPAKPRTKFKDVTLGLTTILYDFDLTDEIGPKRYSIFGKSGWEAWWQYDCDDGKLLQLRIYEN